MRNLKTKVFSLTVTAFAFLGLILTVNAQNENSATEAYLKWKENTYKKLNKKSAAYKHQAMGISVTPIEKKGITVDVSIGTSPESNQLNEMEFIIQPISVKYEAEKVIIEDVGQKATMKSPKIDGLRPSESGIVASPKFTLRTPTEANAVKIIIKGFSKGDNLITITIPIKETPTSASIGKILPITDSWYGDYENYQWFTGNCSGICPETLCAQCNNNSSRLTATVAQ